MRIVGGFYSQLLIHVEADILAPLNHHSTDAKSRTDTGTNRGADGPASNSSYCRPGSSRSPDLDGIRLHRAFTDGGSFIVYASNIVALDRQYFS